MATIKDTSGFEFKPSDNLEGVNFDDVDLECVDFSGRSLAGSSFWDANLINANFSDCSLYWAVLCRANMKGANLTNVDACGANFSDSILYKANLSNANLGLDSMNGPTNLQGANLSDTTISGAVFEGAIYNASTKFPDGFDPLAHNMKLIK